MESMSCSWSNLSSESASSSGSDCEGVANSILKIGQYATTWAGTFSHANLPVILKLPRSSPMAQTLFDTEVYLYSLLSDVADDIIPHFYGCFSLEDGPVLVLEKAGQSLKEEFWEDDKEALSLVERINIFGMLQTLHKNGISHNDFYPRNVIRRKSGNFCVIDFQLADTDHVCLEGDMCEELSSVQRALKFNDTNVMFNE
ncbi:hypothetical protein BT96DRAFT_977998 [Gymnopus androsaceus JB14]|uniref:Protein kinase domain-containing protein n=1 Tax=Gymnopus androsaceus JB14 TaxID=1447944 RepID=A0A6A4HAY8_9AGAR|nr:hypothetical protein BT96DRAFT_977998 [Gymnopus androsaceus JB14]